MPDLIDQIAHIIDPSLCRKEGCRCSDGAKAMARRKAADIVALLAATQPTPETARPLEEWNEDTGDVLWWKFPVTEAPYVGSPVCLGQTVEIHAYTGVVARGMVGGWPGYHTHFTPLPSVPAAPQDVPDTKTNEV